MTCNISKTSQRKAQALENMLKLATKVEIVIKTFDEDDSRFFNFVIEHYEAKLEKNIFIDFTKISNGNKSLLEKSLKVRNSHVFQKPDWILYVNLKHKTANNYINYIKYYFM